MEWATLMFLLLRTSNFVRNTRELRDVIINVQKLTMDFFLPVFQFTESKVEMLFDGMG
jgi:hypothetical protein